MPPGDVGDGDSPEEVVFTIQGFISEKGLPPIIHKSPYSFICCQIDMN